MTPTLSEKKSDYGALQPKTSAGGIVMAGLVAGFLLFGIGGVWATQTVISGAVIAFGSVSVVGEPKTVQHLDGGIVAELNVVSGQNVQAGDVLLRLNDKRLLANKAIYENLLVEGVARRARLMAERNGDKSLAFDNSLLIDNGIAPEPDVENGQRELFQARRSTRTGQAELLRKRVEQYRSQREGIAGIIESNRRQFALFKGELDGVQLLKDQGLATNNRLATLQRQREQITGQLSQNLSELARIDASISGTEIEILQIERNFLESVLQELRELEERMTQTVLELTTVRNQIGRTEVRAPVEGIVHALKLFTVGGIVTPADTLMQIIPQEGLLKVVAKVEPQSIDEISTGQEVALRFSAFKARTTPEVIAKVDQISPDVIIDNQTGASFYELTINLTKAETVQLDGQILSPGMPVDIFVKTNDRTPLNYLLSPLTDFLLKAGRGD